MKCKEFSPAKRHRTNSAVVKWSFMCINIRIAILNPQRSEIRPVSLGTHTAGFKHLFKMLRRKYKYRSSHWWIGSCHGDEPAWTYYKERNDLQAWDDSPL